MSTKIFNAYLVSKKINIEDLIIQFQKFKELYITNIVTNLVKCSEVFESESVEFCKSKTELSIFDLISFLKHKTNVRHYDIFSYKLDAMVYFYKKRLYVQFFGISRFPTFDTDLLIEEFFKEWFTDYHYQNQSDPYYEYGDNKYTKEEKKKLVKDYKQRELVWNEIFSGNKKVSYYGLCYEFFDTSDCSDAVFEYYRQIKSGK